MTPRKYSLKPTRNDHPIKQRPFYSEIRDELNELETVALKDLVEIENRVLDRRPNAPTPSPDPTPAPPATATSVDMLPLLQPVRDQGQQGSCFAFAGTAGQALCDALGSTPPAVSGNEYAPADLSWNTRKIMGTTDQDSGGNLGDACQAMEAGTCLESFMPYNQEVFATAPSSAAAADSVKHPFKGRFYPIDMSTEGALDQALADGCPVYIGFWVWQGFENTGSDGVVPPPDGSNLGGHAQLFFFTPSAPAGTWGDQNSWSSSWGLNGRCWFPKVGLSTIMDAFVMVPVSV
jgi:hypothetical protein